MIIIKVIEIIGECEFLSDSHFPSIVYNSPWRRSRFPRQEKRLFCSVAYIKDDGAMVVHCNLAACLHAELIVFCIENQVFQRLGYSHRTKIITLGSSCSDSVTPVSYTQLVVD